MVTPPQQVKTPNTPYHTARRWVFAGAALVFCVGLAWGYYGASRVTAKPEAALAQQPDSAINSLSVLPDFSLVTDVDLRKRQFFDYLEGYVNAENARILATRRTLGLYDRVMTNGYPLSPMERRELLKIADEYRLEPGVVAGADGVSREVDDVLNDAAALVKALLERVDAIPVSLVLAQAANESAWGTSRFAVDGNNLFGQWCYVQGCGFVPYERASDADHEVRRFRSINAGVRAYFRNLNTHPSYTHFRRMRARMRSQERALDPIQLAYGLASYSQRGDFYIDEVQTIIQQNDLHLRDEG